MDPIHILIACDSFKGSLTSWEAGEAVEQGLLDTKVPLCTRIVAIGDGGEGTVEALTKGCNGHTHHLPMRSSMGKEINGHYGVIDDQIAVIETASPLGFQNVEKKDLDPRRASSQGMGELLSYLLDQNFREFYIGLGGSSINDGGIGMLRALGMKFYDEKGEIPKNDLLQLANIEKISLEDFDPRIQESKFHVLCDVDNPLCGKKGATKVFGKQKGVQEKEWEIYDKGLKHYGEKLEEVFQREFIDLPGAGAAGGLGMAFIGPMAGEVYSGIDRILELIDFSKDLDWADLVITGEGQMDRQSIYGKAPVGIVKAAKKKGLPVMAIAGALGDGAEELYEAGFDIILDSISSPCTLEEAMENGAKNIRRTAFHGLHAYLLNGSK